jgi:rhamnosyl/mannosyltransferase
VRVLHLGKYFPPSRGGIETVTRDLVEGFTRRGIVCDALVASSSRRGESQRIAYGDYECRIVRAGVPLVVASTPLSPAYILSFLGMKDQYDVVVVHLPNPLACLALMLSGFRGRVVLIWHSDVVQQRVLRRLLSPLFSWTIRRADVVVGATSAHLEGSDYAEQLVPKGIVIPFGLDTVSYGPPSPLGGVASSRSSVHVLAIGRLVYYKGFDVLLDAMALLPEHYCLDLVGSGPLRDGLERRAQELGLSRRVTFRGTLGEQELREAFQRCDIVCLPSVQSAEMFGMVQLEAMYHSRPLVVTDIPRSGVSSVNRHGVTGFTVKPGSSQELRDAIHALGESPELRERFGRAAHDTFQQNYTMQRVIDAHVALYRDCLARTSRR